MLFTGGSNLRKTALNLWMKAETAECLSCLLPVTETLSPFLSLSALKTTAGRFKSFDQCHQR